MPFISLNQISPGLISSGMYGTRSLYNCCLGMRMAASRLLLTINWWSCKILQITSSSQKLLLGLVQHYPIRLLSPIWVSLAECTSYYTIVVVSSCSLWWPHVLLTIKTLYSCNNVSDVCVTASEHSPPGTDIATDTGAGADNGETRLHQARHSAGSFARCVNVKIMHKYSGAA